MIQLSQILDGKIIIQIVEHMALSPASYTTGITRTSISRELKTNFQRIQAHIDKLLNLDIIKMINEDANQKLYIFNNENKEALLLTEFIKNWSKI